jgi:fatty acid desaturase
MNYHVEHHLFPLIPYHQLPKLHAEIKPQLAPPYRSTLHAYAEIVPTLLRQRHDPDYYVRRPLPEQSSASDAVPSALMRSHGDVGVG